MGRISDLLRHHFYREPVNQREYDSINIMCDRYLEESGTENMPILTFLWLRNYMAFTFQNSFHIFVDLLERLHFVYICACIFIPLWLLFVSFDWPFYSDAVGLSSDMISKDMFPVYGRIPKFNDPSCPAAFNKVNQERLKGVKAADISTSDIADMAPCRMQYEDASFFEDKYNTTLLPGFASNVVFGLLSAKNVLLFGSMFGNIAIMSIIPLLAREEIKKNIWWLIYCTFADKRKKFIAMFFAVIDLFITIWCSFVFVWSVVCYYKWYTYYIFDDSFPQSKGYAEVKQWVLKVITLNLFALLMNIPGFLILTEFDERILNYFSDTSHDGLKTSDLFTTKQERAEIKERKRQNKLNPNTDAISVESVSYTVHDDANKIKKSEVEIEQISWKNEQRFFAYKIISYYNLFYLFIFLVLVWITLEPYVLFFSKDVPSLSSVGLDSSLNMETVLKYKLEVHQKSLLKKTFGKAFMDYLKLVAWPDADNKKLYDWTGTSSSTTTTSNNFIYFGVDSSTDGYY